MIQFLGLHLGLQSASVAILGRDMTLSAKATAIVHGGRSPQDGERPADASIVEVPTAEWVRAGTYAIQEAYFQLPVSHRKPWGLGLSGPGGWIGLSVEYEPITPLRLTGRVPPEDDLAAWLRAHPKEKRHLAAVLSPKDYFRFAVSGGLAADVTQASRMRLLQPDATQWSEDSVAAKGLELEWLPPVFDCHVPTGRLSAEGIRQTGLPGGSWLVAGAQESEAALLEGSDFREKKLWIVPGPDPSLTTYAYGVPTRGIAAAPEGWRAFRSALPGFSILEREGPALSGGALESASSEMRRQLEGKGLAVDRVVPSKGDAAIGAAILAAIGSGLVKDWTVYYRRRKESADAEAARA